MRKLLTITAIGFYFNSFSNTQAIKSRQHFNNGRRQKLKRFY